MLIVGVASALLDPQAVRAKARAIDSMTSGSLTIRILLRIDDISLFKVAHYRPTTYFVCRASRSSMLQPRADRLRARARREHGAAQLMSKIWAHEYTAGALDNDGR